MKWRTFLVIVIAAAVLSAASVPPALAQGVVPGDEIGLTVPVRMGGWSLLPKDAKIEVYAGVNDGSPDPPLTKVGQTAVRSYGGLNYYMIDIPWNLPSTIEVEGLTAGEQNIVEIRFFVYSVRTQWNPGEDKIVQNIFPSFFRTSSKTLTSK